MKNLSKYLVVVLFLISGQVMASSLSSAKSAGIIGEQANGYIGFVKKAPKEVRELVKSVNGKRKARYKKIAIKQKISLNDVAKIGGAKTIEKTKIGNFIKPVGQGWIKKK